MKFLRDWLKPWPSQLALVLSAINPAIAFGLRSSAPEGALDWVLFIIFVPLMYGLLALPAFIAIPMIASAKRPLTQWVVLIVASIATAWEASIVSFPFKTASSMAVSTMNAAMIAGGLVLIAAAIALFVERRWR